MPISDFNHIKDMLEALDLERPSRFAYTQDALDATGAAEIAALTGVYEVENSSEINSIPTPEEVAMDSLIVSIGLRSQAATLSRMMINHFFGRLSLNLVKLTEKLKLLVDEHLVNRYITPSGYVMEDLTRTYAADQITLVRHRSRLDASAPMTSSAAITILGAVYNGNAGVMTGADKKVLDDLDDYAVRTTGAQSIAGVKTFIDIPAFNGGTSGVSAPFTVDSINGVANLNADLHDGYHAGNATGQIPVSNGTLNVNLNAERINGTYLSSLYAVKTPTLNFDTMLESGIYAIASASWSGWSNNPAASSSYGILSVEQDSSGFITQRYSCIDSTEVWIRRRSHTYWTIVWTKIINTDGTATGLNGYTPGNATGQIPVSNGTVNTNLNADKIDGADLETIITNSDTKVPSSGAVIDYVNGHVPIGTILMYGKATAPTNYLICNGDDINRTTFSALFAVIGTAYGVGDNSTTFNLPNYNAVVPKGPGTQVINGRAKTGPAFSDPQEDQLQNVTGSIPIEGTAVTGAFQSSGVSIAGGGGTGTDIRTDFSFANAGARNGSYTRDSSLGTNFVIRYQ